LPASCGHAAACLGQKAGRIGVVVCWICVWKQLPNVGFTNGSKECIGNGMQQCVAVAVPHRTTVMLNVNAAQSKRTSLAVRRQRFKSVEVPAVANV
jgi:hypothetical protein